MVCDRWLGAGVGWRVHPSSTAADRGVTWSACAVGGCCGRASGCCRAVPRAGQGRAPAALAAGLPRLLGRGLRGAVGGRGSHEHGVSRGSFPPSHLTPHCLVPSACSEVEEDVALLKGAATTILAESGVPGSVVSGSRGGAGMEWGMAQCTLPPLWSGACLGLPYQPPGPSLKRTCVLAACPLSSPHTPTHPPCPSPRRPPTPLVSLGPLQTTWWPRWCAAPRASCMRWPPRWGPWPARRRSSSSRGSTSPWGAPSSTTPWPAPPLSSRFEPPLPVSTIAPAPHPSHPYPALLCTPIPCPHPAPSPFLLGVFHL